MEQNFSANLRRLRKEKGFTQEQLADAIGVSIDELFGRKEETPDIFNQMLQYLQSFPLNERIRMRCAHCIFYPRATVLPLRQIFILRNGHLRMRFPLIPGMRRMSLSGCYLFP